jgi:UDP-N-acetylglucosamine:LPS N-acetylglucosamine transferase
MTTKKVLYVSGSLGLGHVIRDLSIASELRRQNPGIEISWLACPPATRPLIDAGEHLLPEATLYGNENVPAEKAADKGYRLNVLKYGFNARREFLKNIRAFRKAILRQRFDLIIADEAYEIAIAVGAKIVGVRSPFVMIYDFLGMDSATRSPVERLVSYMSNLSWPRTLGPCSRKGNLALFVGEPEDIPDGRLGVLAAKRREYAEANLKFVGYVLPFDPVEYTDRVAIKKRLRYGEEPLVVCSIGGTSVGKELLELCGRAYPIIRNTIPNLRMVLVCGPRLAPESLNVPKEMDVIGYVPALYEHLAASDLSIVQGGGTTTLELTALRRPFLYFPLERHFEQQVHVAARLARHRAGIRMSYPQTTPDILAGKVISEIGRAVSYPAIRADGAQRAAKLISQRL